DGLLLGDGGLRQQVLAVVESRRSGGRGATAGHGDAGDETGGRERRGPGDELPVHGETSLRMCRASMAGAHDAPMNVHRPARVVCLSSDVHVRRGGSRPMRVLVVEDEPRMAGLIRRCLVREGHAADVAGRGEDAVWMAGATEYDAVVLDVRLPGMS